MFQIDPTQLSLGFQQNNFGDRYLYAINQNTFAQVSSDVIYQDEYGDSLSQEDTFYLIVGTDSGLLIKYFQKNPPAKGSTVLFVEFDEVIEAALLDFQPEEEQRIFLTNYEHWLDVAKQHDFSKYLYINKINTIQTICIKDHFFAPYALLWKQIDQQLSELRWQHLASSGAKIFIEKQIENLNENQFSAIKLKGILSGKTVVMLAGGPSLDLYLDWVEANREHLTVIAVSRIARRLKQSHIIPDFFTAIDPNPVGFDVSKEVLEFSQQSILINHYHLTSLVLSQWQGLNFYVGPRYPWHEKNQPEHVNAPGPTVTNVALQMAVFMRAKRVILLGVDLCFSPEGFSHASGSIEHTAGPMISQTAHLVTTNDGQQAETDNPFYNAIQSLSNQAKQALKENCQFINPSPQAAQVDGVDYIPIDELDVKLSHDNVQTIDLQQDIQALLPDDLIQAKQTHYSEIQQEIKRIRKKLKKILAYTQEGLDHNAQFFKNNDPEKNFKFKLKMDKVEQHLNNDFGLLSNLCRVYGIQEFLRFLKPYSEDLSSEEIKEWGDVYYQAYQSGAQDLDTALEKAYQRAEMRILELQPYSSKQLSILCPFWQNDQSPGRAIIYQNKNKSKLEADDITLLKNCQQSYLDIIHGDLEKTTQFSSIKKRSDLNGTELKAYNYFIHEDSESLQRLIKGLNKHQGEQAPDLLALTQGYEQQLNNDIESAIQHYEKVSAGNAQVAALKQLSVIFLSANQLEMAEIVLYNLACMSIIYVPKLANLYKIQKRYKDALDTYTNYLDVFPEDVLTLIKLASLYRQLKEFDAEKFVYQHILTIDENNSVAQTHLQQLEKIK